MRRLLLLLAASALAATPVLGQHQHHHPPPAAKKPAAKKPAAKKPAAKKPAAKKPAAKKPATGKPAAKKPAEKSKAAADPHAGHQTTDPHAGHQMPEQKAASDPHAGPQMPAEAPASADPHAHHAMPGQPAATADPHSGHAMGSAPQPPEGPPPPAAFTGPEHAADAVYGPQPMAAAREELRREHGDLRAYRVFIERAETRVRDGRDGYLLDAQAWYGGDIDKAWFKGELEGPWGGKLEHAEVQALWSHAIDPWFDLQTGVRYDPRPGPDRAHLVLGVQGLAPYWWEVDGALFLSNKGEVTARAEAEYDLRITQQLILQPRGEIDLSLQDIPELGTGSGLSEAAIGARLRYQLSPLVAPYVGVEYERAFGDTRRFLRAEGEKAGGFSLVAGLRTWF